MSDPITTAVALTAAGSAAVGIMTALIRLQRKAAEETAQAWQAAATRLGGRFSPRRGAWYARQGMRIDAEIEGLEVYVEQYTEGSSRNSQEYTRVVSTAVAPPGFELSIQEMGLATLVGDVVGAERVRYDDDDFDGAIVVRSSDADLAALWLTRRMRRALSAVDGRSWSLAHGTVTVRHQGLEGDTTALVDLLRTTAALGARGRDVQEMWMVLGSELGAAPAGEWPTNGRLEMDDLVIEIESGTSEVGSTRTHVRASRTAAAGENWTMARRDARLRREADALAVRLDEEVRFQAWSSAHAAAVRRLDQATQAEIRGLEPLSVQATAQAVMVTFAGLVLDRTRLERAAALARALCGGSGVTAYR